MGLRVLSLFDGISCGRVALERAGIDVDFYFASEIDKHAIAVTQKNYPDTIQIGDVNSVNFEDFKGGIDLLIGGSPCQGFSLIGKQINFEDPRSKLFFKFVKALNTIKPKYFLLENVKMKKEYESIITTCLGVEPVLINSSLVSYQNRKRLYWCNWEIPEIKDRHINFQDYRERDPEECRKYKVKRTPSREKMWNNGMGKNSSKACCGNITNAEKVFCLTLKQDRAPNSGLIECDDFCRYLTRKEIEQAQTLPVGYCDNLTYNQMQKTCGNCWTVDVIAEIFKGIKI